jgi:hypothetical protein
MASNGPSRRGLLSAGGVVSIVAGIIQINNGAMLVLFFVNHFLLGRLAWEVLPFLPGLWFDWWQISIPCMVGWRPPIIFLISGLSLLILGILAMAGGISAVRQKRFGLSLAGAICALGSGLLGILAVIFVALGKREFRDEGLSGI